jgi:sporulation protein YlmC with PRC-barrel domain
MDVYNNQDENIGEIEDMVIDNGKTVRALIISVGGFLGMGEHYVAVDPSTVTLVPEEDNDMRAIINTSRDDLQNAPTFKYERTDRP